MRKVKINIGRDALWIDYDDWKAGREFQEARSIKAFRKKITSYL